MDEEVEDTGGMEFVNMELVMWIVLVNHDDDGVFMNISFFVNDCADIRNYMFSEFHDTCFPLF